MSMKTSKLDQQRKDAMRTEIARVRERYEQITREHLFDDSMQRITLDIPKSVVYLALFLSIMDDESPEALSRWLCADGIGRGEPTLQRNLNRKMRQFLADEITTRLFVKMAKLQAECREDQAK